MLYGMHLLLGEKWAYDPHSVISHTRIDNRYSAFIHESRQDLEKLASKGVVSSISSNVQTLIILKKSNKIGKEVVVDSEDEEHRAEKRAKFKEESIDTQPGL